MLIAYEKQRARNALAVPGVHSFAVVLDHLKASFNVPKIFRSAEAFGAAEVHLVGVHPFDPRPALGSFRKVPARFFDEVEESLKDLRGRGFTLVALDPFAPRSLHEAELPEKSAFVFGHEEFGFSFRLEEETDIVTVTIPQFGEVQSLNVSVAASIAMYEYTRQWTGRKGIEATPAKPTSDRHKTTADKVFGRDERP
jgi:tRNA G18 (ribose-2'-O)-methylase SpoU